MATEKRCPDCRVPIEKIQLVDLMGQHGVETGLTFLKECEEAQVSIFKATVASKQGKVHGHLFPKRPRVLFYASPS